MLGLLTIEEVLIIMLNSSPLVFPPSLLFSLYVDICRAYMDNFVFKNGYNIKMVSSSLDKHKVKFFQGVVFRSGFGMLSLRWMLVPCAVET